MVRRDRAVRAAVRLHQVRAGAAPRRRTGRHQDPAAVHGRRGFHQPDRRPGLPGRNPDRGPGLQLRLQRRPRLQVGLRPAAQHRGHPGHAAGVVRSLGRAVQYPFLGGPRRWHLRVHLRQLPPVRDARGNRDVRRIRAGAVRIAVTRGEPKRVRNTTAQLRERSEADKTSELPGVSLACPVACPSARHSRSSQSHGSAGLPSASRPNRNRLRRSSWLRKR